MSEFFLVTRENSSWLRVYVCMCNWRWFKMISCDGLNMSSVPTPRFLFSAWHPSRSVWPPQPRPIVWAVFLRVHSHIVIYSDLSFHLYSTVHDSLKWISCNTSCKWNTIYVTTRWSCFTYQFEALLILKFSTFPKHSNNLAHYYQTDRFWLLSIVRLVDFESTSDCRSVIVSDLHLSNHPAYSFLLPSY